jgi:preprotein translocase subunit SecF
MSLLVVGSWIMGATTLQEFGVALGIGLIVGAYSSLFIAVPAVIAMKEREPHNRDVRERLGGNQGMLVTDNAVATPAPSAVATPSAGRTVPITPAGTHPPRPRKKGKRR